MANNLIYSEFFDKYLKGKLSESERIAFNEKVRQDPLLSSELKLQKEIYTVLGETRKAVLKSRLDHVPVNNLGWFSMQGAKLATMISSALVIATGTYFYYQKEFTAKHEQTVVNIDPAYTTDFLKGTLSVPVPKKVGQVLDLPKSIDKDMAQVVTPSAKAARGFPSAADKINKTKALPEITRPALVTDFDEDTQHINYKDFEVPEEKIAENTAYDNANIDNIENIILWVNNILNIDIENIIHPQYNFHYQLVDNKLYLYGNFGNSPYKIIALNFDKGKKLFLEYNDHFYGINNQQTEIVPLQVIEDSILLRELKKISTK